MSLLGLLPIIQALRAALVRGGRLRAISGGVLLRDNLDRSKELGEPGAGEFVGLLGVVALGHEDEVVAGG